MKPSVLIFLLCTLPAALSCANLGEDKDAIIKRYGSVVRAAHTPDGLETTDHHCANFLCVVIYRDGRAVAESFSLLKPPFELSEATLAGFLKAHSAGLVWAPTADGVPYRTWLRAGALASYETQSPEHHFMVAATQVLDGKISLVVSPHLEPSPGPSTPPMLARPPEKELITVANDHFSAGRKISLAQPVELISHELEMDMLAVIPEGRSDLSHIRVDLRFTRRGYRWRYLDYHPLTLLIDGKRLPLGDLDHQGDVMNDASVLEQMSVWVDRKTFASIANAENVEAKLGTTEFSISYDARAGFRQFLDRLPSFELEAASAPLEAKNP